MKDSGRVMATSWNRCVSLILVYGVINIEFYPLNWPLPLFMDFTYQELSNERINERKFSEKVLLNELLHGEVGLVPANRSKKIFT